MTLDGVVRAGIQVTTGTTVLLSRRSVVGLISKILRPVSLQDASRKGGGCVWLERVLCRLLRVPYGIFGGLADPTLVH